MLLAERITLELILALVARGPAHTAGNADVSAAEARIDAARAARQPRVTAELRGGVGPGSLVRIPGTDVYVSGQHTLDDVAAQARYGAQLTVEQPLYDFGRTAAAVDAARALRDATAVDGAASLVRTRRAAADAFFSWARADAVAEVAAVDAHAAEDAHALVVRLVGEGKRPAADADAPETEWLRAELAVRRALGDADAARHALEVLVGPLPPDSHPAVDGMPANLAGASMVPTSAPGAAPTRVVGSAAMTAVEPDLAALHAQIAAARAEVRARERAGRPTLAAAATLGLRGLDDRLLPGWDAGLTLSIPLHDAALSAATREARARVHSAEARAAQLELQTSAETRAAADELARANERAALAERLVAAAARASAHADQLAQLRDVPDIVAHARAELRHAELERTLSAIDVAAATFHATPR